MLYIRNLEKHFRVDGRVLPILDIPAWQVVKGEQVAITGPSGCGKSTLLHLISGMMRPDKGEIYMDEIPLHLLKEAERDQLRASQIGYVLQDFHLIPSLTVKQNVELALNGRMPAGQKNERIGSWLEKVGLQDRSRHLPSQLSRGQQQRVAIVRALVNEPALILADEPTGSLDWETAAEISELLLELSATGGHTLVVVTHDLNMARQFPVCLDMYNINRRCVGPQARDVRAGNSGRRSWHEPV